MQDGHHYALSSIVIQEECPKLDDMTTYRYRYNGKEQLTRFGGQYDYGFRMYNAGIARFFSVDPTNNLVID